MTKKQCPLGEACDLTTAWMAGAANAQDQIKAQAAEIERLLGERERLALAICGGEDAPGYANAQTIETLEKVARDNHNTTMEQIDRIQAQAAEIERLRGDLAKVVEALQIARVHVANNAEGWSVSRAPSRDDLTIVDSILSALTGAKP